MKKFQFKFGTMLMTFLLTLGFLGFTHNVQAQSIKPVTIHSSNDFDGTISAIKKAVSNGGMMVLSELNQGKILSMTGLHVKGHSFFIGNPNVGKQAFSEDPSVGLVVPVRVNVYEENGKTYVNYFKPSDLFSDFHNKKVQMISQKLDDKLSKMMKMIT